MWIVFAFGSALFAAATAILAKVGVKHTDSHLVTALRTVVVLVFAWLMVFVVGSQSTLPDIDSKSLLFLILSGLTTGASWICYFRALQWGDVNKVAPIDKSSTVLTMLLAFLLLGEPLRATGVVGMVLIAAGTYLMLPPRRPAASATATAPAGTGPAPAVPPASPSISSAPPASPSIPPAPSTSSASPAPAAPPRRGNAWLVYAVLSAVFASATALLGKVGIAGVESNLGTAIRTVVVLVMAWILVFLTKKQGEIRRIDAKSWWFIVLSGLATGLSWLCYYRALQEGPASVVVPIDKLSILPTVLFSVLFLKERLSPRSLIGLLLLCGGTLVLLIP